MIRRAWQALYAPPASDAAAFLRAVVPLSALFAVLALLLDWRHMPKLMDVVWLGWLLWVVRQRDEARTRLKALANPGPPDPKEEA